MENTDRLKKVGIKMNAYKWLMLVLILFALYQQMKLIILIKDNIKELDTDPLVFSANKYNIDNCVCFDKNRIFEFDKNKSSITYLQKSSSKYQETNISILENIDKKNGTTGNN